MVGCHRGGTAWGVRSCWRARGWSVWFLDFELLHRRPCFNQAPRHCWLQSCMRMLQHLSQLRSNLRTRSSSSPRTACERSKRLHLVQQQRLCACLRWGCTCPSPRSHVSAAGRSPRQILPGDVMKVRTRPAALATPTTPSQVLFQAISGLWHFLGSSGTLLVVLIGVESVGKCARACAYVRPPRAPPAQASAQTPCCYATEQRCKAEQVTRGPGLEP